MLLIVFFLVAVVVSDKRAPRHARVGADVAGKEVRRRVREAAAAAATLRKFEVVVGEGGEVVRRGHVAVRLAAVTLSALLRAARGPVGGACCVNPGTSFKRKTEEV